MLTDADIEHMFTYQPPTAEQVEKYKAIKVAYQRLWSFISDYPDTREYQGVNDAAKELVKVMVANCPPSADLSAAIHCVRLTRNAFNAWKVVDTATRSLSADEEWQLGHALEVARIELLKAKWQANAAIALHRD